MYNYPGYGYYYYGSPDSYGSDIFGSIDNATLGGIFIAVIIALMFFIAVSVICYVVQGIALYTLAKRRGLKNPYFAFIPIANLYLIGDIADSIGLTMNRKTRYAQKILVLYVISLGVSLVTFPFSFGSALLSSFTGVAVIISVITCLLSAASSVIAICSQVYVYVALYTIYKEYVPRYAVAFEVLSIVFSITQPFFLLYIRNKKSGYELWLEERRAEARANAVKFDEEVAETSIEEVFTSVPVVDDEVTSDQTVIEQPETEENTENCESVTEDPVQTEPVGVRDETIVFDPVKVAPEDSETNQ